MITVTSQQPPQASLNILLIVDVNSCFSVCVRLLIDWRPVNHNETSRRCLVTSPECSLPLGQSQQVNLISGWVDVAVYGQVVWRMGLENPHYFCAKVSTNWTTSS